MSKNRYSAKVDNNQPDIVKTLRGIPGVTVEIDHDDILVGFRGRTHWYEIKQLNALNAAGDKVVESKKQPSQKKLERTWAGHYKIVWKVEQILEDLGIGNTQANKSNKQKG